MLARCNCDLIPVAATILCFDLDIFRLRIGGSRRERCQTYRRKVFLLKCNKDTALKTCSVKGKMSINLALSN